MAVLNCGIVSKTILCIVLYYPLSVGLTFYNKWFLKSFKFPLFVVLCHYCIKWLFAVTLRCFRRSVLGSVPTTLQWKEKLYRIAPIGITASVDIGLSNWSLELITVSLYTMSKSTAICFILLFAIVFKLEDFRRSLIVVVMFIAVGLFMFTYQSTQFDLFGFALVEFAALCSGVRWTVSQLITQKEKLGLKNPLDVIYFVQPWMIISVIPLVMLFEGEEFFTAANLLLSKDLSVPLRYAGLIGVGGTIAFFMETTEYLLLINTSSLTLSVCGILKEIVTLYLAHHFNQDNMSWLNFVGLLVCLCGISLHGIEKVRRSKIEAQAKQQSDLEYRLLADSEMETSSEEGDGMNDSQDSSHKVLKDVDRAFR